MHKCLPRDATHSAVFAVVQFPSVCHIDVSKWLPIPIPNTEIFQNTDTKYQTDMKNTDENTEYRYRLQIPTQL